MTHTLRTKVRGVAALASLVALAACSENTPTGGVASDAVFSSGSGSGSTATTVEITLTHPIDGSFVRAKGKAKFASKPGERELQVEVENIPAGTSLNVFLGGVQVGTATTSTLGEARLNLNSKRGDAVPQSVAGAAVSVQTAAGVVVTGSF